MVMVRRSARLLARDAYHFVRDADVKSASHFDDDDILFQEGPRGCIALQLLRGLPRKPSVKPKMPAAASAILMMDTPQCRFDIMEMASGQPLIIITTGRDIRGHLMRWSSARTPSSRHIAFHFQLSGDMY